MIFETKPTWNYSQTVRVDTPNQRDLQHLRNQRTPRIPMQDLSNHTMDATISTSSNADPSTTSDVRSWPTSNNSGRCSERHTGSHSKNRDKTTPQKQNPKRLNMLVNINGYHIKNWLGNVLSESHTCILCTIYNKSCTTFKRVYYFRR